MNPNIALVLNIGGGAALLFVVVVIGIAIWVNAAEEVKRRDYRGEDRVV